MTLQAFKRPVWGGSLSFQAWRCVVWYGNIKPEARNSRTTSDGAQFISRDDARRFIRRVEFGGGKLCALRPVVNPSFWYESLAEFDAIGSWSLAEIEAWKLDRKCKRRRVELLTAPELATWALAHGWTCEPCPFPLYDEEGIEGWTWEAPDGREWQVIHDEPGPAPIDGDELPAAMVAEWIKAQE
tara:strand:- start:65 stop:619 length:555 start_codon:yes stop_codon:yes gene_type:complete